MGNFIKGSGTRMASIFLVAALSALTFAGVITLADAAAIDGDHFQDAAGANSSVTNQVIRKGWGYMPGNGLFAIEDTPINYGITFDELPFLIVKFANSRQISEGAPTNLSECYTTRKVIAAGVNQTTNGFKPILRTPTGLGFPAATNFCYTWIAIGRHDASFDAETDPQVGTNATNYIPKWNGAALVSGIMYESGTGNIGIGTSSPQAKLDIKSGGTLPFVITDSNTSNRLVEVNLGNLDPDLYMYRDNGSKVIQISTNGNIFFNGGNVGIGTTNPSAGLHLNDNEGALFTGTYGSGSIPAEGAGTRAMWYPGKAAFRVGHAASSQWDDANIGAYSFATGISTTASGSASLASGFASISSGSMSASIGESTKATGDWTMAVGYGTTAQAQNSFALGRFNVVSGSQDTWVDTDPLFVIGNGTDLGNTANAMTVLKNGKVGIGTPSPSAILHAVGDEGVLFTGTYGSGSIPAEGAGTRAMWYPGKAAFRVGHAASSQWDDANIGAYSFATGISTTASGSASLASGFASISSGSISASIGESTKATGDWTMAVGYGTTAQAQNSFALGRFNVVSGSQDTWVDTDPLFVIGNGTDLGNTANAMTVLKNGKVGIGTPSPSAILHAVGDEGVLFTGTYGSGSIPAEGAGTRAMWYPGKAAFRVGHAASSQWDDANIGAYSFATGISTTASGSASLASGFASISSGSISASIGESTKATGDWTMAVGYGTTAQAQNSFALGRFNVVSGSQDTWVDTEPLFVIGNGTNTSDTSNAMTVLKNGRVGIGLSDNISHTLHIGGSNSALRLEGIEGTYKYGAMINFGDGSNAYIIENEDDKLQIYARLGSAITGGHLGVGTTTPGSRLHVDDGFLQIDTNSGTPGTSYCDSQSEVGRMIIDSSNTNLYVCTAIGWVTK